MWKLWLVLSGIFLIIEIINVSFLIFWFSLGALLAMIVSFFIDNVFIQAAVFLVSSTILLFATRPVVNKILPKDSFIRTNSASAEGKIGLVIKKIDSISGSGQIKIGTEVWSAKSEDGSVIEENSKVEVIKIDGVKAVVKKI
ncbi:MAG: NfeD family protein [Clostridia bacterium]|nr:NfeD family protein [Clostridia bacterium]